LLENSPPFLALASVTKNPTTIVQPLNLPGLSPNGQTNSANQQDEDRNSTVHHNVPSKSVASSNSKTRNLL